MNPAYARVLPCCAAPKGGGPSSPTAFLFLLLLGAGLGRVPLPRCLFLTGQLSVFSCCCRSFGSVWFLSHKATLQRRLKEASHKRISFSETGC